MELDINALDLLPAQKESQLRDCRVSCDVSGVDPELTTSICGQTW
jgi:hypothetical protein